MVMTIIEFVFIPTIIRRMATTMPSALVGHGLGVTVPKAMSSWQQIENMMGAISQCNLVVRVFPRSRGISAGGVGWDGFPPSEQARGVYPLCYEGSCGLLCEYRAAEMTLDLYGLPV